MQALFAAVERTSQLPPTDAVDVTVSSIDIVLSNPMRSPHGATQPHPPPQQHHLHAHAPVSPALKPVVSPHAVPDASATTSASKAYVAPLLKEQAIELPQQLRVIGVGEIGGELRAWAAEGAVALGVLKFAWFRIAPHHAAAFNAHPLGCVNCIVLSCRHWSRHC